MQTKAREKNTRRLAITLILLLLIFLIPTVQADETTHESQTIIGIIAITETCSLREMNENIKENPVTVYSGDIAYIISNESDWYYVNYNMRNGYIHKDAARIIPNIAKDLGKWVVTTKAEIYANNNTKQKENMFLSVGEKVDVRGYSNGWMMVTNGEKNGYIKQEDLIPCEKPKENHNTVITTEEVLLPTEGEIIVACAMEYISCPYMWGGTTATGFDCSGFVWRVFTDNGYDISRTADSQYNDGMSIEKRELQEGDIVFFGNTYKTGTITHCGIYVGNEEFIHAASSRSGVRIDSLSTEYYAARYVGACRLEKPEKKKDTKT